MAWWNKTKINTCNIIHEVRDRIDLHSLCNFNMYIDLIMIKQWGDKSFSSQMCKVHVWSVSTKGIQMSIIMSITVSKATTNLTKHDRKLTKTLNKWKIMIWTTWYNKTEYICTILNWNHALLWVILTKQSNTRLRVPWIDN